MLKEMSDLTHLTLLGSIRVILPQALLYGPPSFFNARGVRHTLNEALCNFLAGIRHNDIYYLDTEGIGIMQL